MMKELEEEMKKIEVEEFSLTSMRSWTEGWGDSIKSTAIKMAKDSSTFLTPEYMEKVKLFGSFYTHQLIETGNALIAIQKKATGILFYFYFF